MSKRFIKPPDSIISRATSIDSNCCRLLTASVLISNKAGNHTPISFDQQAQVSQGHTSYINNPITTILLYICLKKNQNAPRPSEHPPVRGGKCQNVYYYPVYLWFKVVSHIQAYWLPTLKTLHYTVANPARGLLNREKIHNKRTSLAL